MKQVVLLTLICMFFSCEDQKQDKIEEFQTHFELSEYKETATYLQVIDFYIRLAKEFPEINIQTIGETDSGYPLHLVTFNIDGDFNFQKIGKNKTVILINNGIHPGESDGIDATMLLYRDLATGKVDAPENTVLATIPVYNVGGALNRNSFSRANQNGPTSYGFRGNAQNYDLNRDFIKVDTKNAVTFASIFHLVQPDIFIDNHVSNGADYQYTLTHLFTQHNKLGGDLGNYLNKRMMPKLSKLLQEDNWEITPYVNVFNKVPESGFSQFMDYPRYSTGYTTLWNTLGMMVETHMLKPYEKRVEGTYELMVKMIAIAEEDGKNIKTLRKEALTRHMDWTHYPVQWKIDTTRTSTLKFRGYEADTLISEVTGLPRLKYDRTKPFTKEVNYSDYFIPTDSVAIPEAYILKKGWHKVIELLNLNNIEYTKIDKDTTLSVESYRIADYKTQQNPYEGHYPHSDTKVSKEIKTVSFSQGDYYIPTNQTGIRYLLETLEPQATDSFFNWNFFDTILQQKEGFSPYVFEDVALEILQKDPELKAEFDRTKDSSATFSANWYKQLDWLFKNSKYYEDAHLQYPVYRILKSVD
ncbi:M14 family metallopeptidase [Costertonia aggregata]|uniref:M14 family metallopeptidase n=1 Tax=Costertonia aggregata TaxID=343403 RepID=A0A7H9ALX0_9FLAO|nr:M14 family metallopeptidase [Costertonia aggregata]QLG44275.1 M14 family metallopeptidase [Costertonia aggregata]